MDETKEMDPVVTVPEMPAAEVPTAEMPATETPAAEAARETSASSIPEGTGSEVPVVPYITAQTAQPAPPVKTKKPVNKKLLCIIGAGIAAVLVVFAVLFFTVIRPNAIYDDAVAALEHLDFEECQRLLDKIPNHKGAPALEKDLTYAMVESYIEKGNLEMAESLLATLPGEERALTLRHDVQYLKAVRQMEQGNLELAENLLTDLAGEERAVALQQDIQYLKAVELADQGKLDDAKLLLDKIPDHDDPNQLRERINYGTAMDYLESGNYKGAYELFSQLGDYEDAAAQKKITFYEALAFRSLFEVQSSLKNPASLRVTNISFYENEAISGELDVVHKITATNSYGGSLGAYVFARQVLRGENSTFMMSHSDYADPDDAVEALQVVLIELIRDEPVFEVSVDVARMNRLLENKVSFNIDLPFNTADVVES